MIKIKYTIHGFQQDRLIEHGLTSDDALVLSVIKEMYSASKTEKIIHNGEQYVWVKQTTLSKYLPILGSLRKVQGIFKKITDKKVCDSVVMNSKNGVAGKFYYIKPNDILDYLSDYDKEEVSCEKTAVDGYEKTAVDHTQILHNKDSPTIHSPTISYSKPIVRFDEFWDLYLHKVNKAKAKQIWISKKLDNMADEIIEKLNHQNNIAYSRHLANKEKGYIPHPTTYLNGERWDDDLAEVKLKRASQDLSGQDYENDRGFD